ncbi:antitermination protein Q [Erwinia tasmaniensis]|uniref:Lambdoid prophage Qin antitermination protein Q-like protein n=1 Tax=Erwinia tasmaniensis (strain DSM 17950 / CFBP 7177 / CIP 109463 / NCPPB 4357 / Et1/99) TaxID=465817 RepID=B2VI42_ERWT9|nr:antitermination protein [Erwinia tasmaniensis]CAO96034.1 Lambdoid prophage Qin antitermination protein Q-like protein [Erwinia tasmaniensis Et1/99]
MKIEKALNYFNPKGQAIIDGACSTSTESLSPADVMAALAICQARTRLGVNVWLGKTGISQRASEEVIKQLTRYARKTAPPLLTKAAGNKVAQCMRALAVFAWLDYSRSAADRSLCGVCLGRGANLSTFDVKLTSGKAISHELGRRSQRGGNGCQRCHGKGTVSLRCRCNGSGRVKDIVVSKRQGSAVDKVCGYCGGRGFRRVPSARVFSAIQLLVPGLTQSSWSRNWKPHYQLLVAKCEAEAGLAAAEFRRITA